MKLIFLGRSGSGKSTLINDLIKSTAYQLIQIDYYRKMFGDHTWNGFYKANDIFIDHIRNDHANQIIECVGTGRLGRALISKLLHVDDHIQVFLIRADVDVCKSRNIDKDFNEMRMPFRSQVHQLPDDSLLYSTLKRHFSLYSPIELINNNQLDYSNALNRLRKFL